MLPRGIRNNNPGNIKRSKDPWQGLAAQQNDETFFQCETPVDGVRMLAKVLLTYFDKRKAQDGSAIDTVEEIVARFAPPEENRTGAYVDDVCRRANVNPDDPVNLHDYDDIKPILVAIIAHENANYAYPQEVIDEALRRVGIVKKQPVIAGPINLKNASVGGVTGAVATVSTVSDVWDTISQRFDPRYLIWIGVAVIVGVLAYTTWQWFQQRKWGIN